MADRTGAADPLVVGSVIDTARILARAGDISAWMTTNMFVPDTVERASLRDFDREIQRGLDNLAHVCLRPHDRLARTEEVVRADVARRVPPAGLARLAGHPEEWAGVEHGRIHPQRVLSLRYVEDVDFYENRVAAQLVDRLDEYLTKRIHELTLLGASLADMSAFVGALHGTSSWRRRERIAELVAVAVADKAASAAAIKATHAALTNARGRLRALRHSPALTHADRRARVPMRLRWTNLFTNDRRYRRVGKLWERWAVQQAADTDQARADSRDFPAAYRTYVAALSLRALALLGYRPDDPDAPAPAAGTQLRLRGPAEELTWSMSEDGTVGVHACGTEVTRIVTDPRDFGAKVPEPVRQGWLADLATLPGPIVVVYPGLRTTRSSLPRPVHQGLHPAGFGTTACLVPISPLEIEGEERLARALRWTLQGRWFSQGYPLPVALPAGVPTLPARNWLRPVGGRRVLLLRRPTSEERSHLIREAVDGHRGPSRDSQLLPSELTAALDAAGATFGRFDTCPICKESGARVHMRDRDTFQARCGNCEAIWGSRDCSCGARYPVLWPYNAVIDTADGDRIDRTAGADVLAMPCTAAEITPGSRFRCPKCHECGGRPGCTCWADPGGHQTAGGHSAASASET
ncbi:DUF2357 domain-containing protein [Micromonospora rubida]|uniref:DUF2357 domain-containing protein n=1 Tax=Micromonospora rubida TaxID=2697657 RepID=UPI0013774B38|nr:DUF2357 domain-containing protein [Micromonospora rubida]NBE85412.1 DUF2357 domain-containing protein [Micromonospora rubida]